MSRFCLDKECWRIYEQKVHSLLLEGLGDRAKSICVAWRNTNQDWHVESGLSVLDSEPLFIGISVSSTENAFRTVDIGPDAENKIEVLLGSNCASKEKTQEFEMEVEKSNSRHESREEGVATRVPLLENIEMEGGKRRIIGARIRKETMPEKKTGIRSVKGKRATVGMRRKKETEKEIKKETLRRRPLEVEITRGKKKSRDRDKHRERDRVNEKEKKKRKRYT